MGEPPFHPFVPMSTCFGKNFPVDSSVECAGTEEHCFFPAHLSAALEREGEVRQAAIPAFPLRSSSTHHFLWAVDVARPSECTNLGMFKTRTAMNVQNPREMNKTTARTALTHCIWAFTARVVWHGWVGGLVGVSTQR